MRKALRIAMVLPAALLLSAAPSSLPPAPAPVPTTEARAGLPLPPWQAGMLDIHHINTGRGDASFLILPDGTTLLVDASGKTVEAPPFSLPTRPDASRPPGEWVVRYIAKLLPATGHGIDYAVISHFHGDHMGAILPDSPRARAGGYQLSGITEIAEHLPIGTLIDRGWPDYAYPEPLKGRTLVNYRRFLAWQQAHRGLRVERFVPGRKDQLKLRYAPGDYPQFEVRNLFANGVVWSGTGAGTRTLFPPVGTLSPQDLPIENKLSIAFRVSYGRFDYFTGGDLSALEDETLTPAQAWKTVETPVAQAAGAVDAMKANHHGSWDANSAAFLRLLRPRVIVIPSRADGHPSVNTFKRMTSPATWPGPRDIFVTNVSPATATTTYGVEKAASTQGHVVIRVAPGGASYRVFVLDDTDEAQRIKAVFGPYASQ
ncbi:metallohydrolase [Sphingomonas sp. ST-64]|uniref:Metallohydrolase n=1 Tax=Sphingomonas plantiphila TaxID=3163295 RepID=A0ABW8YQU5_9SPHN